MGKRASAVAALLATSFLGSLLALVLVGRNPLVRPTPDLAGTESLAQEVRARPTTVSPASPLPAESLVPDTPGAAILPASDARPPTSSSETDQPAGGRSGAAGQDADGDAEPAPPAPESAAAEDGVVVSKVAPSTDATVGKADQPKASSNKKTEDEDDEEPSEGSSSGGGSKGGPKEDKVKGPGKGPGTGKPPKEDTTTGSGKGPKGSGNGASETPGNGKGNGKP